MRKVAASLRAISSVAMPEFNTHQSTPPPPFTSASAPAQAPPCNSQKCPWWPYSSSKDFKTNTALILVVLFCGLVCALAINGAVRYLIYLHCSRRRRDQKPTSDGASADDEDVEAASTVVYEDGMEMKDSDCVICLSEFNAGEKVRVLEVCGHSFHAPCVKTWLLAHGSCPTCRTACTAVYGGQMKA